MIVKALQIRTFPAPIHIQMVQVVCIGLYYIGKHKDISNTKTCFGGVTH